VCNEKVIRRFGRTNYLYLESNPKRDSNRMGMMTTRLSPVLITFVVKIEVIMLLRNVGICLQDDMVSWITRPSQLPPCGIQMSSISICKDTKGTTNRLIWVDWGMVYLIRPFIHSQALIVQDGPLASLFRGFLITHTYRYTVGLLWTSDQPVAETSTYTGQHNM
jgi:hypothetical protein